MFIESSGGNSGRGDEDHGPTGESWILIALAWFLPWPALVVWLCVAGLVLDGWVAVGCSFTAIGVAAWRGLKMLPEGDGLNQSRQ